jgi:hypothetical protein
VRLYSRPGNDLTKRFPLIVEAMARLCHPCRGTKAARHGGTSGTSATELPSQRRPQRAKPSERANRHPQFVPISTTGPPFGIPASVSYQSFRLGSAFGTLAAGVMGNAASGLGVAVCQSSC